MSEEKKRQDSGHHLLLCGSEPWGRGRIIICSRVTSFVAKAEWQRESTLRFGINVGLLWHLGDFSVTRLEGTTLLPTWHVNRWLFGRSCKANTVAL